MRKEIKSLYLRLILILVSMAILMFFLVPILVGYPPKVQNPDFQKEVWGFLSHRNQYIIFLLASTLGALFSLQFIFKNTRMFLKKKNVDDITEEEIHNVRKEFYSIDRKLLFFYILVTIVVMLPAYILFYNYFGLKVKFAIIYLLISGFAWVISITMIKQLMITVLEDTYKIFPKYNFEKRSKNFFENMLSSIIPIFLTVFGIIIMFLYSKIISLNGDKIYEYYKTQLREKTFVGVNLDDVKSELKRIEKYNESDFYFVADIENDNKLIESENDPNEITDFMIKYANHFIEGDRGRTYEYFGVESEAIVVKGYLQDGSEVWVGFKYSTGDKMILLIFIFLTLLTTIIYLIITAAWSKNMSYTLSAISESLNNIATRKKVEKYAALPIYSYDEIGELAHSYNEIQRINNEYIEQIKKNQQTLLENERLISLGQMIGGIAHNLKTPILSIAGAAEGIKYLAEEMEESLTTSSVTIEDKKEIIKEQEEWVKKIKIHLEYMNDIITAVKGQATTFTTGREMTFSVNDLFKNVKVLTAHEFKNALLEMEFINNVSNSVRIQGDFNSLLQVINNIVINAIQAYDGRTNEKVQVIANIGDISDSLVISIKDNGEGIPREVQDKLFRQMVTTKGKYGTGLGLYMSYSTIKGKFQGEIKFDSELGKGSIFHIIIPLENINKDQHQSDLSYISEHRPIDSGNDKNKNKKSRLKRK